MSLKTILEGFCASVSDPELVREAALEAAAAGPEPGVGGP